MTFDLSPNARRIFDLRYPRKGDDGLPTETPEEVVDRVASNVAVVSALYSQDPASPFVGMTGSSYPGRTARRQFEWLRARGLCRLRRR